MSSFLVLLFCLSLAVLVAGLGYKIYEFAKTPAPLLIPTTPAPITPRGAALRVWREVLFFESLFRSNRWTWGAGMMFHAGLALVLLRHLRYFTDPVWGWVAAIQPFGIYAGFLMAAGLLGLLVRRICVERIRYISTPSDYLMLVLLLFIASTGLTMKFIAHTDIIGVKNFFQGIMHFNPQALPADALLYMHLLPVALLMVIFPFSKLLHAPGIFFSPTRYQADNPREHRHIAPWAAELEK